LIVNKKAIFRIALCSCLLVITGLLGSCAALLHKSPDFEPLPYKFQSAFTEFTPRLCYIGTVSDWHACLKQLELKPESGTPPVEQLLAGKHLLLLYGGMRPTTGFTIEANSLHVKGKSAELLASLNYPCMGSIQADMITYPVQLIAIKPFKKQRSWVLRLLEIQTDCDDE
jgi:hypothetical protein